jgi:glutamate/tyrosine decarboxylase-like PLP-dependent enzyme
MRSMHENDEQTKALAAAIFGHALIRLGSDQLLDRPPSPVELGRRAGQTITADGLGGEEALRIWSEILFPSTISIDHPAFMAFVPGAPTKASALFDLVISASATYGGTWIEGAGAVWAENQVIAWLAGLAGMPEGSGGCFVTGGTAGNLSALVAARHAATTARRGARPARWRLAAAESAHSSVISAARVMDADVLTIPMDDRGRLTGDALRRALDGADDDLFAVVASAGSTNVGLIDELDEIATICRDRALWLHIDGAYGGAALLAPSIRDRFRGIEHADSLTVDPHKLLFAPFDACALIYRDPANARSAHIQEASYLETLNASNEWNPSDLAHHLSRRPRGLPLWFSLVTYGTDAYRDAIESLLAFTRSAADEIRTRAELELLLEPELSVVLFRRIGWTEAEYEAWWQRLLDHHLAFVQPTSWNGEKVARLCFTNPRTTMDHVRAVLDQMA